MAKQVKSRFSKAAIKTDIERLEQIITMLKKNNTEEEYSFVEEWIEELMEIYNL